MTTDRPVVYYVPAGPLRALLAALGDIAATTDPPATTDVYPMNRPTLDTIIDAALEGAPNYDVMLAIETGELGPVPPPKENQP